VSNMRLRIGESVLRGQGSLDTNNARSSISR
jgi:hypothetical protein